MNKLSTLDHKTLEAVSKDSKEWRNRVFKVELDTENNQIKVISKRKKMKGKYFIVPLFEELTTISTELLERFIYSKYTTSIFMNL